VTTQKEKAHSQLQKNTKAFDSLASSFRAFDDTSTNVIGGNSGGNGDSDGPNSKIILDALPSAYDFPALATSVEKLLDAESMKVTSVTGVDDQLTQQSNVSSPTPQPVPMTFAFTVSNANYDSINKLLTKLQQSIRPIQIDSMTIAGGGSTMTLTVNAHTYYQPAKNLTINTKVVK
jgi:hypothetical protein